MLKYFELAWRLETISSNLLKKSALYFSSNQEVNLYQELLWKERNQNIRAFSKSVMFYILDMVCCTGLVISEQME